MILTVEQIIIIAVFVLLVGILANIAGFGGGILVVPFLAILFSIPLRTVIGSTLAALAIPSLIGFIGSWKRNEVDFQLGIALEIPTIIGVVLGTQFTSLLPDFVLELIFGSIAFVLSLFMIRDAISGTTPENPDPFKMEKKDNFFTIITKIPPMKRIEKENYSYRLSIPVVALAGLVIGFLAGLLGVGGGWIKGPLLILGFGLPPIIGSGTALFMLVLTAFSGGITHYLAGNVSISLFLAITIALSVGAFIGNYIKPKLESKQISVVIASSLSIVSVIMIVRAVQGFSL